MVLFKDINRSSTDLLTKDYPHEKRWDVDLQLQSKNPKCNTTACLTPTNSVDTSATLKYSTKSLMYEVKFNNAGTSVVDVKYPVTEALTVGTRMERSSAKTFGEKSEINTEYSDKYVHANGRINPFNGSFNVSTVLSKDLPSTLTEKDPRAFIGGEVGGRPTSLTYALGLGYRFDTSDRRISIAAKTAPQGDFAIGKVIGNVYAQSLKSRNEFTVEVQNNFVENKGSVALGALWRLQQSYGSFVKARVGHDGRIAGAFCLPLDEAKLSTATFGLQVDSAKLRSGGSDAFTYGLKLNLRGAGAGTND